MSGCVVNQRWPLVAGNGYEIIHISDCVHESNEIPTAIPMFSGSSNMTGLVK